MIEISFNDRDEVSQALYQVSGEGEVHVPLIGPVKIAGINRAQARSRIDELLKNYIRNPEVKIHCIQDTPEEAVNKIIKKLRELGYIR